jgi:asparagine synthase (glutamine-hydrolysing)
MCGITGIISIDSSKYIGIMTEIISHRGPDDFGIYTYKNLSLGHRRLSIQDLSDNGHQPMFTDDKRYIIVFNGEIYNHWDIRKDLEDKYNFKSTSDTETLLYGFIEYGLEILNKLNGIFAFAIFDHKTNELFLARDQFGVKPLYYYIDNEKFIFSSEIKSINQVPTIDRQIDSKALLNYLRFLWSPGEKTPFKYVKKLLPGYFIKVNIEQLKNIAIEQYYDIPFKGIYSLKNEIDLINELDEKLTGAVKRQLLSDVPVAFFLSGGLDSSAIVAIAKKLMPEKKIHCYTIDSGLIKELSEGFSDDLFYAKKVSEFLDVELHIVNGKSQIMSNFDKMIYHLDEPQADVAPLHVYNICKQAKQDGFKVLLGGTGGDDVFSGYRRHQALKFESFFKYIPRVVFKIGKYIFNNIQSSKAIIRRIKKILNDADKSQIERIVGYFTWVSLKISKKLLHRRFDVEFSDYIPLNELINSLKKIELEKSLLNKMLYLELKYFLPDHNLNYTDKMSMATGVEVRVPFLDKELLEFSTTIPPELKMKGDITKYILKKLMERYLPHDVIYRPKAGFGAPVRAWIKNEIFLSFSEANIDKNKIFDFKNIMEIINDNNNNKYDASYTILSLLAIDSWITQFSNIKKNLSSFTRLLKKT